MLSRPLLDRVAFLGISWYAVLIVGAMVIGYFLASNEARRLRLPQDTVIDFMLYAVPLGIICARLYYVAFRFNDYSDNLLSVFNIREGGLAIYGGVIGGLIAAKLVSRKHKISMLTLLDVVAPALVLGQGIGRWGNYINMEAYGLRIAEESLQFFPFAVEIPVGDVWYWHMATFFYEFCWDMLVFVLLMAIRKHRRRGGDVFCWYLLLYCSGRTVIEGLRNDSLTFISEFVRISQILSAVAAAECGDLLLSAASATASVSSPSRLWSALCCALSSRFSANLSAAHTVFCLHFPKLALRRCSSPKLPSSSCGRRTAGDLIFASPPLCWLTVFSSSVF